jgi:hypothetical protein
MFDIIVLSSSKMVNHVLDQTLKADSNSFHIITPFNNTNTEPSVKITVTDKPELAIENRVVLVITNDCYLPKFWEVQFLRTLQIDTSQVLVPCFTNSKYQEQQCPLFETFTNGIYLEKLDWYNRCSKPSIKQISNCSVDASLFGYTTFVDTPLDERNWNILQSCIIGNGEILTKDTNTIINLLDLI